MLKSQIKGRAWVFGDNVTTDEILPSKWKTKFIAKEDFAKYAFEPLRPEIYSNMQEGDMIVGGKNFGFGSSREQAALAIIGLGVQILIAESFARIFYRNCINVGIYPIEGVTTDGFISDMDNVSVDFSAFRITNNKSGKSVTFTPLPKFMESIVQDGGLIEFAKGNSGNLYYFK